MADADVASTSGQLLRFAGADAFARAAPHILTVDNFFDNPEEIRTIALAQEYSENLRRYNMPSNELGMPDPVRVFDKASSGLAAGARA